MTRPISVLTVAGSDSGGGAGIQADLKTFQAFGLHGLSVITAVTSQNTRGVTAVASIPASHIRSQLDAVIEDFRIGACKTGMLGTRVVVNAVAAALAEGRCGPLVVDPVMIATSGARLLDAAAIESIRTKLLPLADLATPNIPEAEALTGMRLRRAVDADAIARRLLGFGARAVLLKGGHARGAQVVDRLYHADGRLDEFVHARLRRNGHGTGCTLAAAIAASLARGDVLVSACATATDYVHRALLDAYRPGRAAVDVLAHGHARDDA